MLSEKIKKVLSPNDNISIIDQKNLYMLKPMFHLDAIEPLSDEEFKDIVFNKDVMIYNRIAYLKHTPLLLQSRISEIVSEYKKHIKNVIGDRKPLIDLYQKLSAEEIASLVSDHIIFSMTKNNNGVLLLTAMRYMPEYLVKWNNFTYKFPPLVIRLIISGDHVDTNPYVTSFINGKENIKHLYLHPFVYSSDYGVGQKVCLGSFSSTLGSASNFGGTNWNDLPLVKRISILISQTRQILISGYRDGVHPANGHLRDSMYQPFKIGGRR
jgi:hypothetical protein